MKRIVWLVIAGIQFLVGLWLFRRPDVVDKLISIGRRLVDRKRGTPC
ncbi:MAG: hypothetical protein AABZ53_02280 [Planctomycetota bacterium]